MIPQYKKPLALLSASILAVGFTFATASAQQNSAAQNSAQMPAAPASDNSFDNPQALVDEAAGVVDTMKSDPQLLNLMNTAKGIYIVPDTGRAAIILGGHGGTGVALVKTDKGWSDPAFYDFGAISIGSGAGISDGSVAFLLMSQRAVDAFKNGKQASLNADAGLSIVDYSATTQASWGKGDIIMWSDTGGADANAAISVTDVNWDEQKNSAYYGRKVDFADIVDRRVQNAEAGLLVTTLPG